MEICTIGFTQTTAEGFFTRLVDARVERLLDVRLNNSSQLPRRKPLHQGDAREPLAAVEPDSEACSPGRQRDAVTTEDVRRAKREHPDFKSASAAGPG